MVKTGASVALEFLVTNETGALSNSDTAPIAVLVKNSVDTATVVTIANISTGVYSASVTMPALAAGDIMQIRVAATIGGVTTGGIIWRDDADTAYISQAGGLDAAGVRAAIGLATANADAQFAALPTAVENADALLDEANGIETGLTVREGLRLALAALAGKLSGGGTGTIVIRNPGDTKNRITATVDVDNNRLVVVYDLT